MSTVVTLPGGAFIGGGLARIAAIRPLTGRMEQQLAELAQLPSIPHRVSYILAAALDHIGNQAVTPAVAASLSVPDRQFLMLALALETGVDQQWRHLTCAACSARFDIGFRLSEIPLALGSESYPWADISIAERQIRLRVPSGEDEESVANLDLDAALRALALRCVVGIDGEPPTATELAAFDETDVSAIDAALDAVAPQLGTSLRTACNECGALHSIDIDPYRVLEPDATLLYRDIHTLALRYHWSEAQILRLPRSRRQFYLDLVEQSPDVSH